MAAEEPVWLVRILLVLFFLAFVMFFVLEAWQVLKAYWPGIRNLMQTFATF